MHFCIVPLLLSYRKKHTWANRKPGSVLDDHPSCTAIACSIQRLTLGRQRATALYDPFLVLLRMGFTRPSCLQNAGELLPHHFNLTTALPVSAECFCCTFPIVTYARRYLASSPFGARTFLMLMHAIVWLTHINYHIQYGFVFAHATFNSTSQIPISSRISLNCNMKFSEKAFSVP